MFALVRVGGSFLTGPAVFYLFLEWPGWIEHRPNLLGDDPVSQVALLGRCLDGGRQRRGGTAE